LKGKIETNESPGKSEGNSGSDDIVSLKQENELLTAENEKLKSEIAEWKSKAEKYKSKCKTLKDIIQGVPEMMQEPTPSPPELNLADSDDDGVEKEKDNSFTEEDLKQPTVPEDDYELRRTKFYASVRPQIISVPIQRLA
jgi:chromosome segregation ATPase